MPPHDGGSLLQAYELPTALDVLRQVSACRNSPETPDPQSFSTSLVSPGVSRYSFAAFEDQCRGVFGSIKGLLACPLDRSSVPAATCRTADHSVVELGRLGCAWSAVIAGNEPEHRGREILPARPGAGRNHFISAGLGAGPKQPRGLLQLGFGVSLRGQTAVGQGDAPTGGEPLQPLPGHESQRRRLSPWTGGIAGGYGSSPESPLRCWSDGPIAVLNWPTRGSNWLGYMRSSVRPMRLRGIWPRRLTSIPRIRGPGRRWLGCVRNPASTPRP